MGRDSRFVFDTGVLVSAAIFPASVPGQALRQALRRGRLVLSQATTEELAEVLSRPKFDRYIRPHTRRRFLAAVVRRADIIEISQLFTPCRDPKDNKFLDVAVSGQASFLVTGDSDLLALNPFQSIPILTPANFVAALASE
jgi:uncharacterized protein